MVTTSFITTTTTSTALLWTAPADFNGANNTIHALGSGGGGSVRQSSTVGGTGGGAGSYAKNTNVSISAGKSVGYILPAAAAVFDTSIYDLQILLNSNTPGGTSWNAYQCTITAAQTDSQGGTTAALVVENGVTDAHGVYQNSGPKIASTAYSYHYYGEFKATGSTTDVYCAIETGGGDVNRSGLYVNFANLTSTNTILGTGVTPTDILIVNLGNGWVGVSFIASFTAADTNTGVIAWTAFRASGTTKSLAGTNAGSFYVGRPMMCYGSYTRPTYTINTSSLVWVWSILARYGTTGTTSAAGVGQSGSVGTTTFQGGSGFKPAAGNAIGGGGGGSAGPSGAGSTATSTSGVGGAADNSTVAGGAQSTNGTAGTEFDGTHGCGSGAGGRSGNGAGFIGGGYGGGGSGSGTQSGAAGGAGFQGLIAMTYSPPPPTYDRESYQSFLRL